MNNEDAQAILFVVLLIAILAIVFIPFALFIGYTFFQKRKRDQTRAAILRDRQQLVGSHRWFPVRYASEQRFKSLFKIFPWEGAGILVVAPGSALFLGQTPSGSPVMLQFAPGNSTLNWLGKSPWPNGAVSWFSFTTATPVRLERALVPQAGGGQVRYLNGSEKHYFSSETGLLVIGSHKSTRAIYDEVSKSFLAHSAPRD